MNKRKTTLVLALIVLLVVGMVILSNHIYRGLADRKSSTESVAKSTPADDRIATAQNKIRQAPGEPDGYNLLASAYSQKGRETGDFSFYASAEEALARSFEVSPDNYDALKLRARLLLTYHRFREGLEVARRARDIRPGDHDVYGALTDALVELGEYDEAIKAAQTMVDLRPDTASYSRVSYLRELHGDTEGAIEAMMSAVKAANPQDPENLAWCRVQLGNLLMNNGKTTKAEREFDEALRLLPDYKLALEAKARARAAVGDLQTAVAINRREQEQTPTSADAALALGDLATRQGRSEEAARQYSLFESLERANAVAENDWHHLVYFWADHDKNLDEALSLAQKARETRSDIHTCDALAWTQFKRGLLEDARESIDEALRLGTRDARILYHAGRIYSAIGEKEKAARYLKRALKANASFDVLQRAEAERMLESMAVVRATRVSAWDIADFS